MFLLKSDVKLQPTLEQLHTANRDVPDIWLQLPYIRQAIFQLQVLATNLEKYISYQISKADILLI